MKKLLDPKVFRSKEGWLITVHKCDVTWGDYVRINAPFGVFRFIGTKEDALNSVRKTWRDEVLSIPKFSGGLVYDVDLN